MRIVDKITDLPVDYSKYLTSRRPDTVPSRPMSNASQYQPPQQYTQAEPAQQYRTAGYNYPGILFSSENTNHSL